MIDKARVEEFDTALAEAQRYGWTHAPFDTEIVGAMRAISIVGCGSARGHTPIGGTMPASVEHPRPPATVYLERQGRTWVVTVVCTDCGRMIGRYPEWFAHAPDCLQRNEGTS